MPSFFPWWVVITHFVNIFFMVLLFRSGLEVLSAFPKLYWYDDCPPGREWLRLSKTMYAADSRRPLVVDGRGGILVSADCAPRSQKIGPGPALAFVPRHELRAAGSVPRPPGTELPRWPSQAGAHRTKDTPHMRRTIVSRSNTDFVPAGGPGR